MLKIYRNVCLFDQVIALDINLPQVLVDFVPNSDLCNSNQYIEFYQVLLRVAITLPHLEE